MGTSSSSRGSLAGRLFGGLLALVLALTVTGWLTAQNAKKEEVEDPAKPKKPVPKVGDEDEPVKPKKKAPEVEEERTPKAVKVEDRGSKPGPKPPAAAPPVEAQTSLVEALRETKDPALQKLYADLKVPHDAITYRTGIRSATDNIEPLPDYYEGEQKGFKGKGGALRVWPYDEQWRLKKNYEEHDHALGIQPYEEIALREVNDFLKKNLDKPAADRAALLKAAETVLASVDRWHASARETGTRRGDAWEATRQRLHDRLFQVQMQRLETFAAAGDWEGAAAYARTLADAYRDAKERTPIAKLLVGMIDAELRKSARDEDLIEARRRFRMLEEVFPSNQALQPITDSLKKRAQNFVTEAEARSKAGNHQEAARLMELARDVFPNLPELAGVMAKLETEHPTLRVGVRRLPDKMTPREAVTDSDRRAVELLYEGLVKLRVEPDVGQRYEPGLSAGVPRLVPLGREFRIARDAAWSDGTPVTVGDVKATLRAMREGDRWPGHSPAWNKMIEDVEGGGDAFRLSLRLSQGYLDPLSLMTFKVMPQGAVGPAAGPNDAPVGSGPYRYQGAIDVLNRRTKLFLANPGYASREGKIGLPRIREIQFVQFAQEKDDPVEALRSGKIDLVVDLSAAKAAELERADDVVVRGPMVNRRVYFLAVNHRAAPLKDNPALRRALAFAIDRQAILEQHFRGGKKAHRSLNGPFPAGSWPCDPKNVPPELYDLNKAKHEVKEAVKEAGGSIKLTLKYPAGDAATKAALEALCASVNGALRIDERTFIELELQEREPANLREDVERTHSYDLAYYHYDHPSEAYWIAPLFDLGATDQNGSNYLGYRDGELQSVLDQAKNHRDFSEVRQAMHLVHRMLEQKMPLIPLWQLDTFLAHRKGVHLERAAIDPLLIFNDVEHWTLDGKR
jgi:ABC-type transport system substrate-binding protein